MNQFSLKWIGRCIVIAALSLMLSLAFAQTEVTVHEPVNGLFVRDAQIGQPPRQLGIVDTVNGTWTPLPVPYSTRSRPLWSPDGESIAYSIIGMHSGVLDVTSGTNTFITDVVTGTLSPFDLNYMRGWSADSSALSVEYAQIVDAFTSNIALYDMDTNTTIAQEIRSWQTNTAVTNMPLPPDATSVQLGSGRRIERNPVFDDWFMMHFSGSGYYSTFDIGEPVSADINVLWNLSTNEYISLDALVPDLYISQTPGDWSHDGTRLLLYAISKDLRNSYTLTFRFTPEQGVTLAERAIIDNRIPQRPFEK